MKTKIVRIGNSQGIRLPKAVLDQVGFGRDVELTIEDDTIVIRQGREPRQDWEQEFARMAVAEDDRLLDAESRTDFDLEDWEW
jgi:antitoxin MazE